MLRVAHRLQRQSLVAIDQVGTQGGRRGGRRRRARRPLVVLLRRRRDALHGVGLVAHGETARGARAGATEAATRC